MNKKLLFAAMSLAALTACTDNDFESKNVANVAGETSSVQFEVINNIDAGTRASMDGNKVVWSAADGDLFTLYHGAGLGNLSGHQNATYTASLGDDNTAVLTTPSMIRQGGAVMVWPVDTTFHYDAYGALTIQVPEVQGGEDEDGNDIIQYQIPYVSDEISISAYNEAAPYNTAGLARKYPVFMRPMASQLNLIADYAGTDATLATLYTGDDPIDPIKLTSVDLLTTTGGGTTDFTQEIAVKFTAPTAAITTQWATVAHSAWNNVTDFDLGNIVTAVDQLTTKSLNGNESCKFLILPQDPISAAGVADGGVVVNTIYGKVVIANVTDVDNHSTMYNTGGATGEIEDAWYRFVTDPTAIVAGETAAATPEASGEHAGKYKVTSEPKIGMEQTINAFSANKAASGVVKGEPQGAAATRYVKVLLTHLDMSDLHIKTDKQLRDAVRVWKKMGLTPVTVYLDGDANKEFAISQKTIETINTINAGTLDFKVQPCQDAGEICDRIVITGSAENQNVQDIAFIADNGGVTADVVLADEGTTTPWKWNGTVRVTATGVNQIINEGTMENAATATLKTGENGTPMVQNNVPFVNDGTWNIKAPAILNVQFDVTNNGTVNIAKGAQYRQDGQAGNTIFVNEAYDLPSRFGGDDTQIGVVNNSGVFATVAPSGKKAEIDNFGLIEHADKDAKTFITHNQTYAAIYGADANFASIFTPTNKMGRINLPYSNKDEDNVSISAALNQGFVSVTIDGEVTGTLTNTALGTKVNYVIVKSGVTNIADLAQVDYLEINSPGTEIAWSVAAPTAFEGLMVLSDVNIKLGTTVTVNKATYLGADMYVGGTFTNAGYAGYYGDTSAAEATKYITY